MYSDSLSVVVECNKRKYVGVATLHDEVFVDVDFYCKDFRVDELIYLASVKDKKIPFSQKGVGAYVKKIVEYHSNSFDWGCNAFVNGKRQKDELSKVIESASVKSSFSATPNLSEPTNEMQIIIKFTKDFSDKAFNEFFKDGYIAGRLDDTTLYLGCFVE